jgi:hypothetical protein
VKIDGEVLVVESWRVAKLGKLARRVNPTCFIVALEARGARQINHTKDASLPVLIRMMSLILR